MVSTRAGSLHRKPCFLALGLGRSLGGKPALVPPRKSTAAPAQTPQPKMWADRSCTHGSAVTLRRCCTRFSQVRRLLSEVQVDVRFMIQMMPKSLRVCFELPSQLTDTRSEPSPKPSRLPCGVWRPNPGASPTVWQYSPSVCGIVSRLRPVTKTCARGMFNRTQRWC